METLVREALPEKQKRFLDYLNNSSDQGVTQLLAQIDQEVSNIEDRISDLNVTLAKVDFRTITTCNSNPGVSMTPPFAIWKKPAGIYGPPS